MQAVDRDPVSAIDLTNFRPGKVTEVSRSQEIRGYLATNVLGWAGAFALVLAASYLIRLGIDSGWLTPARQVGIAALFGLTLIAAGFFLDASARRYAGLLPGGTS
jgi:uncharacterized membrane protein